MDTVASIANMPAINLVVLCVTAVSSLVILALILSRAGFIQVGSLTVRKDQEGQTTMHSMDKEIVDADSLLIAKLRQMTNALRKRIANMLGAYPACSMTKRALASSLRFPLYESIGNNHYTRELMSDRYYEYRRRMLASLEDEYTDVLLSVDDIQGCSTVDGLPAWDEIEEAVQDFLDRWLFDVVVMVKDCCTQKLDTYAKYLEIFTANKDEYRIGITNMCITKNQKYVAELEARIAQLRDMLGQKKS